MNRELAGIKTTPVENTTAVRARQFALRRHPPESCREVSPVLEPQPLGPLAPSANRAERQSVHPESDLHASALSGNGQEGAEVGGRPRAHEEGFREGWHPFFGEEINLGFGCIVVTTIACQERAGRGHGVRREA